MFTLPKGYEMKQDEVDKALALAKAKFDELQAVVLSKIPKAKAQ